MEQTRYRDYTPGDDTPELDQDGAFTGLNQLDPPGLLAPGEYAEGVNVRSTFGSVEPRTGVAKLPWTNQIAEAGSTAQPFERLLGAGTYQDSERIIWGIVAANGKVYRFRQFNAAAEIALPLGEVIDTPVTFTRSPEGLVMFRGKTKPPLIMPSLDVGFQPIVQKTNSISGAGTENPNDGTQPIPNADSGELIANRLVIPFETSTEADMVTLSDYLNVTRYSPVRSAGRINQGSNDRLRRVVMYAENTAIAFKDSSIYAIVNVSGDLTQMQLITLTTEYGICGPKTVAGPGKDLWYLAQGRGVCSIRLTEQNKLQGLDLPVSAKIQKEIDRINWEVAATTATALYAKNFYYLAVPLDDAKAVGSSMTVGLSYSNTGTVYLPVRPGKIYRWTKGASDQLITNGPEVLTQSGEFVAAGMLVSLVGTANAVVTAQLAEVLYGVNNAVLVYDFLRQAWSGYDTSASHCVQEWLMLPWDGELTPFFVGADGFVNCLDQSFYDEGAYWSLKSTSELAGIVPTQPWVDVPVTPGINYRWTKGTNWTTLLNGSDTLSADADFTAKASSIRLTNKNGLAQAIDGSLFRHSWVSTMDPIRTDWSSRGYGGSTVQRKKWSDLELHVATWNPAYQIRVSPEGDHGEFVVLPRTGVGYVTKSPLVYDRPWNAPTWDPTNAKDDHATPHRQDYSVSLDDTAVVNGQVQPGIVYFVESADVESACSIVYNGVTVNNQSTFVGVAGVSSWAVATGSPLVYGPGSYVSLGEAGILFERHQENVEPIRIPPSCRGRLVQVRVIGVQGRVVIRAIVPEGISINRSKGAKT